ncbi:hypothetical protein ACSFXN_03945 [Planococcus sp. 1R117A]|uniref:hypothetical protein n=1 Tax=Planococcus sp. 1R117A TaxID=3447020 RepID=UPI003EDBEF23
MYKLIMALMAAALILTACNNKEEGQTAGQNPSVKSASSEQWASLPEYQSIIEQTGSEEYHFQTTADNEDKRILLLADKSGTEQYKTIFIKNTSRLKIINLKDEGQVFNEILDAN